MRYGSVCSGIEAASIAWRPLGWHCAFVSEIKRFPSAVLAERFPDVPNLGDFTKIRPEDYEGDIDLLVGGTPCQAFSIAGLRKGLEDDRGGLALEFARLAFRTRARWVVWENVPGVLSSGKGADFASFLSTLAGWEVRVPSGGWRRAGLVTGAPGCYSVGWRVLDAQYTRVQQFPRAVPQRRRRVVLAGYLGDWTRVAGVLFDGEMCGGDTPPGRHAGGTRCRKRSGRRWSVHPARPDEPRWTGEAPSRKVLRRPAFGGVHDHAAQAVGCVRRRRVQDADAGRVRAGDGVPGRIYSCGLAWAQRGKLPEVVALPCAGKHHERQRHGVDRGEDRRGGQGGLRWTTRSLRS